MELQSDHKVLFADARARVVVGDVEPVALDAEPAARVVRDAVVEHLPMLQPVVGVHGAEQTHQLSVIRVLVNLQRSGVEETVESGCGQKPQPKAVPLQ